ncbi:hypothetical protein [Mangrovicoccus ximenensis]|uniref:hypothetical protein n=1 Tax=Mangrovicoccus ximenensis TaxID=1911570 RepID=UPI000D3B6F32|nr:hypothetical protein [Mangrovicoccus ximenensis]
MKDMLFETPNMSLAIAPASSTNVNSWKVSTARGTQSGVGVTVGGAGAWARLTGKMHFDLHSLEKSSTYQQMKKDYSIGGGISGFWGWLGLGANASTHKSEIHQVFHEISQTQKVQGHAKFDLEVSGQFPNVQVNASAYVLVMQVTDASGNTYTMASSGDPASDTGAQDSSGTALPDRNNSSTITI